MAKRLSRDNHIWHQKVSEALQNNISLTIQRPHTLIPSNTGTTLFLVYTSICMSDMSPVWSRCIINYSQSRSTYSIWGSLFTKWNDVRGFTFIMWNLYWWVFISGDYFFSWHRHSNKLHPAIRSTRSSWCFSWISWPSPSLCPLVVCALNRLLLQYRYTFTQRVI